ncbi:MAG TPA: hypothetical protein VI299_07685 [Polyangiales bacterium]
MPPLDLAALPAPGPILAEVYEEALDEAVWFCEVMDSAFDDAEHTLGSVASGPEYALFGALEVLELDAGDRTTLHNVLAAPATRYHFQAAVMALLRLGEVDSALAAVQHEDASMRAAAIRACVLLRDPSVLARAQRELSGPYSPRAAAWLELLAAYGAPYADLEGVLTLDDRACMLAALQIASASDPRAVLPYLERLLTYPDEEVQNRALRAALVAHSKVAWDVCQTVALHGRHVNAHAMRLFAALGGASACKQLAPLLASPAHRDEVLFAWGASGCSEVLPTLLRQMEQRGRSAKIAFEAFATITGLDTTDARFASVESEDDQANPSEAHEAVDDLNVPEVEAVLRWWSSRADALTPGVRWLAGGPFELASARAFLLQAPLRRRHLIADVLRVCSQGRLTLDTRARPGWQCAQLASLADMHLHDPYFAS